MACPDNKSKYTINLKLPELNIASNTQAILQSTARLGQSIIHQIAQPMTLSVDLGVRQTAQVDSLLKPLDFQQAHLALRADLQGTINRQGATLPISGSLATLGQLNVTPLRDMWAGQPIMATYTYSAGASLSLGAPQNTQSTQGSQ